MCFLPEGLSASVASERFLPRVSPQMHLDVGLVEESAITNMTSMNRLLFAQQAQILLGLEDRRAGLLLGLLLLLGPAPRLLRRVGSVGRGGVRIVLPQEIWTPDPVVLVEAVDAVLGHKATVDRQEEVVGGGDDVGGGTGGGDQVAAEVRRARRFLLDGGPVLEAVLQQRHVAVREKRLQGGAALLGLHLLGLGVLGVRAWDDELREAVLSDDEVLLLFAAGLPDEGVDVHPAVPRARRVLPFLVTARDRRVRHGRADDVGEVYRDVVLGDLRLDVRDGVGGGGVAALLVHFRTRH